MTMLLYSGEWDVHVNHILREASFATDVMVKMAIGEDLFMLEFSRSLVETT